MRSFVNEVAPNVMQRTDYILSRNYGVMKRTGYINNTSTDSTQSRVNEESKFDNVRDKHGIYGGMMYDEHYQIDFPCYETCVLYKVTFQVMAPFDAGTKIGIFNDKAPVVVIDVHEPDTAGSEYDYSAELFANIDTHGQTMPDSMVQCTFDDKYETIILPLIYSAKSTDFTDAEHDIYGRTSNILPDVNHQLINVGDIFRFTGEDYSVQASESLTYYYKKGYFYKVCIKDDARCWLPAYIFDNVGYEYYYVVDPIDNTARAIPRIINVDPYETDEGELIPVQLHARVIGNESKAAFGYLTIETYPVKRG